VDSAADSGRNREPKVRIDSGSSSPPLGLKLGDQLWFQILLLSLRAAAAGAGCGIGAQGTRVRIVHSMPFTPRAGSEATNRDERHHKQFITLAMETTTKKAEKRMLRRNVSLGHSPHRLPGGSEKRMDAFLWMRHVIHMYSSYIVDSG
jgi:hypothetical protein